MGLYATVWTRPGHATFGQVIAQPPTYLFSFHDGVGLEGDGALNMPSSYSRFDDIVYVDPVTPANTVSSLVRVYDDTTDPPTLVFEWLPRQILPNTTRRDFDVSVSGRGIKSILGYARTEAWDWDGSADFVPTFADWVWGGRDLIGNPSFETATFTPLIYLLVIDATAGTFTISDGVDTTAAIPYNVGSRTLEGIIEAGIAAIDDLSVTPEPGTPLQYTIRRTATSGTFTISDGSSTTAALAFNISAASLETAIEGLTTIIDVDVTAATIDGAPGYIIDLVNPATADLSIDTSNLGGGSALMQVTRTGAGFQLELVTPPLGVSLSVDDSGLTGDASLITVQTGNADVNPWTRSQGVSVGVPREFGTYQSFEQSDIQAHSGNYSLRIGPSPISSRLDAFTGAQQVLNVEPGGLYQAGIWVYPTASGQTYRLVIRGLDEDIMLRADGSEARVDVSPPANTWTFVGISDVQPEDSQVIFRFANTNLSGWPAVFFVDDAFFEEGQAPTTVGDILDQLYADATTDHAGRVVWEDEANPGTPYLTLDFDASMDSAGVAWDRDDLREKIWMRFSYFQVMDHFASTYGYEWRIVPDDPEVGTWLWQVYNPGGMQTDYSAAVSPAIQGGAADTRRSLQRFLPEGSNYLVEGLGRITSRASNAGLDAALGRVESSRILREAPAMTAVASAAVQDTANALANGVEYKYTLVDPQSRPLVAYQLGDLLAIHDPPLVDDNGRLADVVVSVAPEVTEYEVTFVKEEVGSP